MTTPVLAALNHCIRLLAECKEGETSMLIPSMQLNLLKPRAIKNRVLYNLSHQLADLMVKEAEINKSVVYSQQPEGPDTKYTLRTVVMKASTFLDLQAGLNALLMAALEEEHNDEVNR